MLLLSWRYILFTAHLSYFQNQIKYIFYLVSSEEKLAMLSKINKYILTEKKMKKT